MLYKDQAVYISPQHKIQKVKSFFSGEEVQVSDDVDYVTDNDNDDSKESETNITR